MERSPTNDQLCTDGMTMERSCVLVPTHSTYVLVTLKRIPKYQPITNNVTTRVWYIAGILDRGSTDTLGIRIDGHSGVRGMDVNLFSISK